MKCASIAMSRAAIGLLFISAFVYASKAHSETQRNLHLVFYACPDGEWQISFYSPERPAWEPDAGRILGEALGYPFKLENSEQEEDEWLIWGYLDLSATRRCFSEEAAFPLPSILKAYAAQSIETVSISAGTDPVGFAESNLVIDETWEEDDSLWQYTELPLSQVPQTFRFHAGYRAMDLLYVLARAVRAIFAPLVLLLWYQRRILRRPNPDPAASWFWYSMISAFLPYAIVVLLIIASPFAELINFLVAPLRPDVYVPAKIAAFIAVLLLTRLCCALVTRKIDAHLRGIHLSRRETLRRASFSGLVMVFPVFTGAALLDAISNGTAAWIGFYAALSLAALFMFRPLLMKSMGMHAEELFDGALRKRVSALAEKAGLTAIRVFAVVSTTRIRYANAFAMNRNTVLFTDYLATNVTQRELDTIFAHEIAHLRAQHPIQMRREWIRAAVLLAVFGIFYSNPDRFTFSVEIEPPLQVVLWLLILLLVLGHYLRLRRRQEREADLGAIELTQDPEAFISALAKLARLNHLPLKWPRGTGFLLTHPPMRQRIMDIGHAAGIEPERIELLISAAYEDQESHPATEPIIKDHLCGTSHRSAVITKHTLSFVIVSTALPVAAAWCASRMALPGYGLGILLALAVLAAFYANKVFRERFERASYAKLHDALRRKLAAEGLNPVTWEGQFVDFSPGEERRAYGGFSNWDIGFFGLSNGHLIYVGERTRFAIPREQITGVELGPVQPSQTAIRQVCIRWADPERETSGAFQIADVPSRKKSSRESQPLLDKLDAWRKREPVNAPLAQELAGLPLPEPLEIAGSEPTDIMSRRTVFRAILWQGVWTLWICLLLFPLWPALWEGPIIFVLLASMATSAANLAAIRFRFRRSVIER